MVGRLLVQMLIILIIIILIWKARMYGMDFFLCAVLLQPYLRQQKQMLMRIQVLFMQKATRNTITELNEEIANMP